MRAWFENCAEEERQKTVRRTEEEANTDVRKKGRIRVVGALYLYLNPSKGLGVRKGGNGKYTCVPCSPALSEIFLEHVPQVAGDSLLERAEICHSTFLLMLSKHFYIHQIRFCLCLSNSYQLLWELY